MPAPDENRQDAKTIAVPLDVAQKIAHLLAEDAAQPYDLPSSCSYRTELMIGRMLEAGVPVQAIARIYQAIPENVDAFMTAKQEEGDRGSFSRLLKISPDAPDGVYKIPGSDLTVKLQEGTALVQNPGATAGWDLQQGKGYRLNPDNAPWEGKNHITAAIYVEDPQGGAPKLMVIDPHLTHGDALITPQQWKEMVNAPSSVVMAGRVGEMARILPECLNDEQRVQYDAAVEKAGGSKFQPLTRQQNNAVTQQMYGLEHLGEAESYRSLSGINSFKFPAMPELKGFKEQQGVDRKRPDETVKSDWDSLAADGQAGLMQRWVAELKPLRDLQNLWHKAFPPGGQTPENPKVSAPSPQRLGNG